MDRAQALFLVLHNEAPAILCLAQRLYGRSKMLRFEFDLVGQPIMPMERACAIGFAAGRVVVGPL